MKTKKYLALVCVLCITASLAGCKDEKSENDEEKTSSAVTSDTIVSDLPHEQEEDSSEAVYYANGTSMFLMEDGDTFVPVRLYDETVMSQKEPPEEMKEYYAKTGEPYDPKDNLNLVMLNAQRTAVSGKDYYGVSKDDMSAIYHWTLKEKDVLVQEPLIKAEDAEQEVKKILEKTSYPERYVNTMMDTDREEGEEELLKEYYSSAAFCAISMIYYQVDGGDGYIYGTIRLNQKTDYNYFYPLDSLLVRYAKDGSKYEIMDGISASAMTMSEGCIYYYDSGKQGSGEESDFDAGRRGIYKIKPDGSGKEKLLDINITFSEENYLKALNAVRKLIIKNGTIYYMGMSQDYLYDIYKLGTDGGTPEKISEEHAVIYAVNSTGDTLVYGGYASYGSGLVTDSSVPPSDTSIKLIVKDLSDGSERTVKLDDPDYKVASGSGSVDISIIGDYLYLMSLDYVMPMVEINEDTTYRFIDGTPGSTVKGSNTDFMIFSQRPSGERISIKTGVSEKMYCCALYRAEEDIFGAFKIVYQEPYKVIWRNTKDIRTMLENRSGDT